MKRVWGGLLSLLLMAGSAFASDVKQVTGKEDGTFEVSGLGVHSYRLEASRLGYTTLKQVIRCAPNANAVTKELMLKVGQLELDPLLDYAAKRFSEAVRSPEGAEGTAAFIEKRLPKWAQ